MVIPVHSEGGGGCYHFLLPSLVNLAIHSLT